MRKRKRRNKIMVPVASMGDIAFLLIIFFILCGNFAKDNFEAEMPTSVRLDQLDSNRITVGIDENGEIYLDGRRVPDADAIEWGVNAMIEQRLQGLTPDQDETQARIVLFKCDRNVDKTIFEPVLAAISEGGGIIGAVGTENN